jgi:hypothetical protein
MPIHWQADLQRRWPVIIVADRYDTVQWLNVMRQVLEHPTARAPFRLLIDARYCAVPHSTCIERVIGDWESRRYRLSDARIAAVVESEEALEAARLAEMSVEDRQLTLEFRGFADWDEAERWLAGRGDV